MLCKSVLGSSHDTNKNSKPYSDGEMVKEFLDSGVEILRPEIKKDLSKINLSRQITRRMGNIGKNTTLKNI